MIDQFVVDASVAGKWILDDEHGVEEATDYLVRLLADEIRLHAPVLLNYEFGSLLTRATRENGRPIESRQSLQAMKIFLELPITYHTLDSQAYLDTLKLANDYRCSFQDASYFWLAPSLQCRLLTADVEFVRKLPVEMVNDHIAGVGL